MTFFLETDIPADLAQRLQSDDAGIRRIAVMELADHEEEAWLPALIHALGDMDADVRQEAAQRVAGWDVDSVVHALAGALLDEAEPVRLAAAQSLSELKDPQAGQALLPWADHADSFARAAALRALRELRLAAAAPAALTSLAHPQPTVRREAIGVLGWLKHDQALPKLAALAETDADADVRRAAVGALGFASGTAVAEIQPALLAALRDSAWAVREEAATTLGKLRVAAVPALTAALEDGYWQVRLRAARALGLLRNTQAVPALGTLMAHEVSNLRKEVVIALGEIGGDTASALLNAAQADPDPEVRKLARLGLARQGHAL